MAISKSPITPLVLLPIVFFIAVPVLFLKDNIQDIARLETSLFQYLTCLALFAIIILVGAYAALRKAHLEHWLVDVVEVLCFFIIAAGFLFPVSIGAGMIDLGEIPANPTNIFFALLSTGIMVWLASGDHRQTLYMWLILFIFLNTVYSGYVFFSEFSNRGDVQQLYEISGKRNIFVISFDGISGSAARNILEENKELANLFSGFTIFSHVASSSPATRASIATSLYGNKNYKLHYKTSKQLVDSSPDDLLTNYLTSKDYKVSTFGEYGYGFKEKNRLHKSTVARGLSATKLINFTITRTLTDSFVIPGNLLRRLDRKIRHEFGLARDEDNILINKIASTKPEWKKELAATMLDLEKYIRNLNISTSEPVAHFLHFTFTHYPVQFDRDCQYKGNIPAWVKKRQNRYGVKEETYCALVKYADFISRLKKLNVFEQSMIILKSDHGKPVSYYEPGTFLSKTIHGHKYWGYGRYEPFMAIKGFGPGEPGLKVSDSPVLLDDMARTICVAALESSQCQQYPGFDILDKALLIPDDATVTLFVVRDKNSTFMFKTHKAVTVKRQPYFAESA